MESDFNKALHKNLELIGRGFVTGRLFAIPWDDNYYPALILDEKGYQIHGSVYVTKERFADEDLKLLDEYEEFYPNDLDGSEYVRHEVTVNVKGEKVIANVYTYHKEVPSEAIETTSGDFAEYIKKI